MGSTFGWTDDRIDAVKKLWADGLSASQIASRLGGVTRNAVIGKVHRLGLAGRATTSRSRTPRPRNRAASLPLRPTRVQERCRPQALTMPPKAAFAPVESPPVVVPRVIDDFFDTVATLRVNLLDLRDGMCRFPIGDPQDEGFHFCGRHAEPGISYCGHHARLAFQLARRRPDLVLSLDSDTRSFIPHSPRPASAWTRKPKRRR